jgi:hypothetical protein
MLFRQAQRRCRRTQRQLSLADPLHRIQLALSYNTKTAEKAEAEAKQIGLKSPNLREFALDHIRRQQEEDRGIVIRTETMTNRRLGRASISISVALLRRGPRSPSDGRKVETFEIQSSKSPHHGTQRPALVRCRDLTATTAR